MLEWTLTILKFVGIAISGVSAIYDYYEKRRAERIPSRLAPKNLPFLLVVIGLLITLLSQTFETVISTQTARAAEKAAQDDRNTKGLILSNVTNELALQRQSIAYIERLVGTLDSLSISVSFQCLPYQPSAKKFCERVLDFNPIPFDGNRNQQNIVGYVADRDAVHAFVIGTPNKRNDTLDAILNPDWLAQNASDLDLISFLNCLSNLQLNVALFSPRNPELDWAGADFLALPLPDSNSPRIGVKEFANVNTNNVFFRSGPISPIFVVQEPKKRVTLDYSFKMSASEWKHTQRISCITDLANATLWLQVSNCPSPLASSLQPTSLTLNFDKITIVVTNFFFDVFHSNSVPVSAPVNYSGINREKLLSEARRFYETNYLFNVFVSKMPSREKLILDSWTRGE